MKQLLLLRHGKSDWNKPGQEDRERSLAPRGHRATEQIATWIAARRLLPDVALVSSARRTQETWQSLESVFDADVDTHYRDELYLAGPGDILAQLAGVSDCRQRAIVVGHNPGLESLCHLLAGSGSASSAINDLQRGMPTAALAVFELSGDSWQNLTADGARLIEFVRPRALE